MEISRSSNNGVVPNPLSPSRPASTTRTDARFAL